MSKPSSNADGFSSFLRRIGLASRRPHGDALSMFDLSGEAWLVTNRAGGTVHVTEVWKTSFPVTGAVEQGLNGLRSLASESDAAREIKRLITGAEQGAAMRGEICVEAPNGRREWWRLRATPDVDGQVFWRAEDVTSQRERESRGRLESEMVTDFLDNLPVGFFALDARGIFTYANSTLARWLGRAASEVSDGEVGVGDRG